MAGPFGMAGRVIEERVPPATAPSRLTPIEGPGAADDGLAGGPDRGNERLRGIERERRAPDPRRLVRPRQAHGVSVSNDADRPWPHPGEIERHRYGGRRGLHRHEKHSGKDG